MVPEDLMNAKKLAAGRIDMFPIDELAMVSLYKREHMDPASVTTAFKLNELSAGLYMAFSKKTDDAVVAKIKAALASMKSDGNYEKIRAKYLK